jgi:hypothetical protein
VKIRREEVERGRVDRERERVCRVGRDRGRREGRRGKGTRVEMVEGRMGMEEGEGKRGRGRGEG